MRFYRGCVHPLTEHKTILTVSDLLYLRAHVTKGLHAYDLNIARAQGHTVFGAKFRTHHWRNEAVLKDPSPVSIIREDKCAGEKSEPALLRQDT